jgi:hypothetical protein
MKFNWKTLFFRRFSFDLRKKCVYILCVVAFYISECLPSSSMPLKFSFSFAFRARRV